MSKSNVDRDRIEDMRRALDRRGLSLAWFAMGSIPLVEIGAAGDFDAIVLDLQHGLWDRHSMHAATGLKALPPVIGRVASSNFPAIGEALDCGAVGVMVPLIETAEQAREAVSAALFPPEGTRSGGGVRPIAQGFARYHANYERPFIAVMIETKLGVENSSAIAAVPGIDLVFIGTGDLALSLGCFPDVDQSFHEACKTVLSACQRAGVACGIFTSSPEQAVQRLSEGYRTVIAANDVDVVSSGFAQAGSHVRQRPATAEA